MVFGGDMGGVLEISVAGEVAVGEDEDEDESQKM